VLYSPVGTSVCPNPLILHELAERLQCRLEGDGKIEIARVAGIEHAGPGDLTFVGSAKYQGQLATTRASAVIVSTTMITDGVSASVLRSQHPQLAFAHAVNLLTVPSARPAAGVHATSVVAPDARLGPDVAVAAFVSIGPAVSIGARTVIYPHAVIGDGAIIGDDCIVHAHVSIREGVRIGHRVTIEDGAVLGAEGFGFVKQADGTHLKIAQRGGLVIDDDVEIGANTAIDRPAMGETRIGAGTKIDNLVQVGHGVHVGRRVLFAAQVGVAGSTVIEDDVVLAGQVGVADHLRIGKGVVATAQTGIPNSVDAGQLISGYPAIPNRDWLKSSAVFRQLPALRKQVATLARRIAELEEKLEACRIPSDR
jgi:UDP-3-O-[3-hydroxymyristoyl] glucosamine N-acyltransferase